ncbi:hypothetical protein [Saccharopolyspora griseoalba]|uniref:Uncharacterized protein n=1 Tax=Saccharopolyspora griseoalba TaxID=1431848 RepID=A0ABW2LTP6_9PSEU
METTYDLRADSHSDEWGYVGITLQQRWHFLGFVPLSALARQAVRDDGVLDADGMVTLQLHGPVLQDVLSALLATNRPAVPA